MALFGAILDFEVLGELIVGAFVAGIGVTTIFGVAIYGSTRFTDLRRDGHPAGAAVFAVLAVLALTAFAAAVALGLGIMIRK